MNHLMLDIETMGTSGRAPILSIGAIRSDTKETFYIGLKPNLAPPFVPDGSTVLWWLTQNKEARTLLADTSKMVDTKEALTMFADWMNSFINSKNWKIWAKPPRFDISILEHAFSVYEIPTPWHHRQILDLRTIAWLRDPRGEIQNSIETNISHSALDDAIFQANYLEQLLNQ